MFEFFLFCSFQGNSPNFQRPCDPGKRQNKDMKFWIWALQQFGTTQKVQLFIYYNHSTLTRSPVMAHLAICCSLGLMSFSILSDVGVSVGGLQVSQYTVHLQNSRYLNFFIITQAHFCRKVPKQENFNGSLQNSQAEIENNAYFSQGPVHKRIKIESYFFAARLICPSTSKN